jgi:hypothetical protein
MVMSSVALEFYKAEGGVEYRIRLEKQKASLSEPPSRALRQGRRLNQFESVLCKQSWETS